jgi:hypothetical protein
MERAPPSEDEVHRKVKKKKKKSTGQELEGRSKGSTRIDQMGDWRPRCPTKFKQKHRRINIILFIYKAAAVALHGGRQGKAVSYPRKEGNATRSTSSCLVSRGCGDAHRRQVKLARVISFFVYFQSPPPAVRNFFPDLKCYFSIRAS